ncbi:MAG: glycoside hydrolase [Ruminococcus sp.]|nr:glycoside hydrolase [Ruminococcus sp.]
MRNTRNTIARAVAFIAASALLSSCGNTAAPSQTETTTAATTTAVETAATETVTEPSAVEAEAPVVGVTTAETKKTEKVKLETKSEVEIFSRMTVGDLVSASNAMITNADAALDTAALGEHEVNIIYDQNGEIGQQTVKYNVADTSAPVLFNFGGNTLVRGSAFELDDLISYADNYDRAPTASYTGDLDPYTTGDYEIKVTVTDSSGNSTDLTIPIKVTESAGEQVIDAGTEMDFSTLSNYTSGNPLKGIDVSEWQKEIDFATVKGAGCEFCIMRAGYRSKDGIVEDEFFARNLESSKAAGLLRGVYFYSTATTVDEAREEAAWLAGKLNGEALDMPIAFDWENFVSFQQYGINLNDLNRIYDTFASELQKSGYNVMLYGSSNFLDTFWNCGENSPARTAKCWVANYDLSFEGISYIWQCSGSGKLSGVPGSVDLDLWYQNATAPADIPNEAPPAPAETEAAQ